MNLNPISPFSGKAMSDCDERELDAWCAKLCGEKVYTREGSSGTHFWLDLGSEIAGATPKKYGTSWTHAGPLMEREEWQKQNPEINFLNGDVIISLWGNALRKELPVHRSAPAAIRNAFIIAACHTTAQ